MAIVLRPSLGRALLRSHTARYAFSARGCIVSCSSSLHQDPRLRSRCFSPGGATRLNLSTLSLYSSSSQDSKQQHQWHKRSRDSGGPLLAPNDGELAVVLLGWLGAELKHLRRYAEWYNMQGIHALTFVVPVRDLFSWNVIHRVDKHVERLCSEITGWLRQQQESGVTDRNLIFHTFSNTGWLLYGQLLSVFMERDKDVLSKIRGCVVDSAPAAEIDPQIWASGFAAALLKKQSFSTQPLVGLTDGERALEVRPGMTELLLLGSLEKFFSVLLTVPAVRKRLERVISLLSNEQPRCPQLYIYSSADRVIPASCVESFVSLQKQKGYKVISHDMQLSPHVDHFRNFTVIYCDLLSAFLKECNVATLGRQTA